MTIRSSNEVYQALEQVLRNEEEPLTCVALMERTVVRNAAVQEFGGDVQLATNKLSDVLGFMWRRGVIERYPAPRGGPTKARFAYAWPKKPKPQKAPIAAPLPSKKPRFEIVESDDAVTLEFEQFTITVRKR